MLQSLHIFTSLEYSFFLFFYFSTSLFFYENTLHTHTHTENTQTHSDDKINKCKREVQKGILNATATAASRVTDAQARLQKAETSSTKRAIKRVTGECQVLPWFFFHFICFESVHVF